MSSSSLDLSSLMGISLGTLTLGKIISAAVTLLICLVVTRGSPSPPW